MEQTLSHTDVSELVTTKRNLIRHKNYDILWKVRTMFDELSDSYPKYYSPTEHFDEIIVLFKSRVVFKQYIPKKEKQFGIKIYKLCDYSG